MALVYGQGSSISVMMAGPFNGGGTTGKLTSITLPAAGWKGGESPYYQPVTVDGISVNSLIELQAEVSQLDLLACTALTVVNDAGAVTVYAVGDKPEVDITVQATILEVVA